VRSQSRSQAGLVRGQSTGVDPGWRFSGYCRALHSTHLFNFPDTVSGGGALEGVFVLFVLLTIGGLLIAIRSRRSAPLGTAVSLAVLAVAVLLVVAFALASATSPGGP
jgi:hypothetical protein